MKAMTCFILTTAISRTRLGLMLICAGIMFTTWSARADHYEAAGTLEVIIVDDFPNRRSEVLHFLLHERTGERLPLKFDGTPPGWLRTGVRVRVNGDRGTDGIVTAEANGKGVQPLTDVAALAVTGEQTTIAILVNLLDLTVSCSSASVSNMLFSTTQQSVDGLYRETSYGSVFFSGIVVGPYTINHSSNPCDADAWANAADSAATSAGVNLSLYSRKVYVLPSGTCIYGLGTIGGNPSRSWIGDCGGNDVYAHELGHNVGMHHSSTDGNNDGAINDEYGDTSNFMGYGGVGWRQVNAPHKVQMGWLPANKIVTNTVSGTFQVSALETTPGSAAFAQTYIINIPGSSESYYLSYRRPVGYDSNLGAPWIDRLNIHRYSSGAVQTRFISSLADGDSFSDSAVGIEVRQISHDANASTFTVTFGVPPLPSPWLSSDVGGTALSGASTYSGGTFSVTGSGSDIWGTSDGFRFAYRTLSGDGEIVARVTAQENTDGWAKSGVMIRESLAGDSKHAIMAVTPANGFTLQYRSATAGASANIGGGALNGSPNNWVRLVRSGTTITGYKSADGSAWTSVGAVTIAMNANVYVGLAVTAHNNNLINTSTFDNVGFAGASAGSGLTGDYYDNINFTGTKVTRIDPSVNFDWGSGPPIAGIAADSFSVRWAGQVQPVFSETYTFYTTTDDGVRLWVNGQLIIDRWVDQGPTEWSGTISLTGGQKYDIRMDYYENGGGAQAKLSWSSASQSKQIIPGIQLYPTAVPPAPTALAATAGDAVVNLTWTQSAGPGITSNNVYRSTTGSGGPYSVLASLPASTSYSDTAVVNGNTYFYTVTAVNAGGESAQSAYKGATPVAPPATPTGLTATPGNNQVALSWTASSGATSYNVKRSTTSGGPYAPLASPTGTSHTDTTAVNGTTYYYVVSAVNGSGESANSAQVSATPFGTTTVSFTSVATHDGYVLESTESSNVGGSQNATSSNASALRAGDNNSDRQYKAVVSFNTASIPDGATIVSVTLRLRRGTVSGINPFTTHGTCFVDIKGGTGWGGSTTLASGDFQAAADSTQVATLSNAANNGDWSTGSLNATGLSFLNKTGHTQFRVYFSSDDNDDSGNDYIGWYSGDNGTAANRPVLEVTYQ